MKWTFEKLESELWAARKRFKRDKAFIKFITGWIWSHLAEEYK